MGSMAGKLDLPYQKKACKQVSILKINRKEKNLQLSVEKLMRKGEKNRTTYKKRTSEFTDNQIQSLNNQTSKET